MAGKQARAHRREQQLEQARAEQRSERRRRLAGRVLAAALIGAAAFALYTAFGGPLPTGGEDYRPGFGPNADGVEDRRRAAKVPATGDSPHFHPRLALYVSGRRVTVPTDIGIGGRFDVAALHTHSADGRLHVEGMENPTLGQFFAVWGVPFSSTRLGPHRATGDMVVRMWVDGKPSEAFGRLALVERHAIVVAFGRKDAPLPNEPRSTQP